MSDIVERLRDADTTRRIGESYADTHERRQRDRNEAADEIERLRTLLKAIRNFPNLSTYYGTLIVAEIDAALKEDGDEK